MRIATLFILGLLVVAAGCGESVEHKLEQAKIALNSGRPDAALTYAEGVLKERPGDPVATLLSAKAHLRLRHYTDSRRLLDDLIRSEPTALEARRELLNLALAEMADLLGASEFTTNRTLDDRFTSAKSMGHDQADWFGNIAKDVATSEFARARLVLLDTHRIERLLREEENRLRGAQGLIDPLTPVSSAPIEEMRRQIKSMQLTVERHADGTLLADPAHFQAASMIVALLKKREAWSDLWLFAAKMTTRTDLPPALASELVGEVLNIPDRLHPVKTRLETCRKLMAAVSEQGKSSVQWKNVRARLHLRDGEKEQALTLAQELFRIQPNDAEHRLTYGWCLYETGQYAQAKTMLQTLATDRRDHEHIQLLYGLTLDKLGERTMAVEALRRTTELNPANQTARTALVRILAENRDTVSVVLDDINKLYADAPSDPDAIRFKFMAEVVAGNENNIRVLLEAVEKLSPRKPGYLRVLVDGSVMLRDMAAALKYARECAILDKENIETHLALARVHVMRGESDEARRVLVEVRRTFPDSLDVNQSLALLYVNQGSFDRAIELLEELLKAKPGDIEARLILAQAYAQLSLTEEALEQVQTVRDHLPDDPRALELAASIYRLMGQPELAQTYLEKIDESRIEEAKMPGVLAQLKLHKGDVTEALAICNRAIAAGSTDPRVRLTLANIHSRGRNSGEEEVHLIAFVRENPTQFSGYAMLARFYLKHNVERGVTQFKSLRSLNEPLARLSEASLLNSTGQQDEALRTLAEGYKRVIQLRHRTALGYARSMASIIVSRNGFQLEQIQPIYDALIQADLYATDARIAWIDLSWNRNDEAARISGLNEAAAKMKVGELGRIRKIVDRFQRMRRPELGLEAIESWLVREPRSTLLLTAKGDLLAGMLRLAESVKTYEAALAIERDDVMTLDRLARVHRLDHNFPAVEQTLDRMAGLDTAARIRALWIKADLFTDLGLLEQAAAVIEELSKAGNAEDPRILFAMGQCMAGLGDVAGARTRLSLIPRHSNYFGPAQLSLARMDETGGDPAAARQRLEKLAADGVAAVETIRTLIEWSIRQKDYDNLLKWSQRALQMDKLDASARIRWLRIRVVAQASTGQLEGLRTTLDQLIAVENTPATRAARIVVMIQLGKSDDARKLLESDAQLRGVDHGVLLSLALSVPIDAKAQAKAPTHYLAALIDGDAKKMLAVADAIGAINYTVYAGDLRSMAGTLRLESPELAQAGRKLAVALVALETGLPPVSERVAMEVVEAQPRFILAHAVALAGAIAQEKTIDSIRDQILDKAPDSSLALFVQVQDATNGRQWDKGIETAMRLLEREPDHDYVSFRLVTFYKLAGQDDKATELIRRLAASNGPFRDAAANDLAYRLSQQGPEKLDEARRIALELRRKHPLDPNMADTLGWIEVLQGNHESALKHLGFSALRMNNSADVHFHLGRAYHAAGNARWAKMHLTTAVSRGGQSESARQAGELLKSIQVANQATGS